MGKGTYKSISDLITQGYKIIDSNTIFAGEAWEIVDPLLTEFETAFYNLRDAQDLCLNLRVEKGAAADKVKIARDKADLSISRLKRFINYIADKDTADNMVRDLAIEDDLPGDNDEAVSVLMSNVLPHLGDWDGTPQEISAAIKTEVTDATNAFAAAVLESSQKQDLSEVATQDRDVKRDVFEDILARLRNFLYLMLPLERKDERLELYGFDVWGAEGGEPSVPIPDWPGPGEFTGRYLGQKQVELIYGPVKDATHCDIEWKEKNAPNEDYVVLFNNITMDPANITDMRQLSVDKGKYAYRLVPYKDEEKGTVTEIEVEVKD